jgi:hypothetical protein
MEGARAAVAYSASTKPPLHVTPVQALQWSVLLSQLSIFPPNLELNTVLRNVHSASASAGHGRKRNGLVG